MEQETSTDLIKDQLTHYKLMINGQSASQGIVEYLYTADVLDHGGICNMPPGQRTVKG